ALCARTKCSPPLQTARMGGDPPYPSLRVATPTTPGELLVIETRGGPLPVRLGGPLAEGGIGIVHAGTSPGLGPLAIKVLHERHAGDPGIVRRFEREAEHAMRLCHPNVVSALGAGRLRDGRPFFAMERLRGATLGAVVRNRGPLSISRGLHL